MVSSDTVITAQNGFFTADRINANQYVKGANGLTYLEQIKYSKGQGVLVETKHYSVIVSPHQKFFTTDGSIFGFQLFSEKPLVLTNDGEYEEVISLTPTEVIDLLNIITRDGTFIANGLVLLNG